MHRHLVPEFFRCMGTHREADLKRLRAAFNEYVSPDENEVDQDQLLELVELVTEGLVPKAVRRAISRREYPSADFDTFVGLADEARRINLEDRRRNAGFKEGEVLHFKRIFDSCDRDGSGDIDASEITGLLFILGLQIRTREEQLAVMARLDEARDMATAAGVQNTTARGSANFGFWELVQLMRMLKSDSDKASDEKVNTTAVELGFSPPELEQFRKIFLKWCRNEGLNGTASLESSPVRRSGTLPGGGSEPLDAAEPPPEEGLSIDVLCRLLQSMGMSMTLTQKGELEKQVAKVDTTAQGLLSFVGFLRMMRWLLDSDFAGINGAAANAVQRNKAR